MSSVLRAAAVYLTLWLCLRIAGRRTLAQMTNFDLILLLFISESAQNGLMGTDTSLTNSLLVIATLIGINVGMSLWARQWPRLGRVFDGLPLVLVAHGRPIPERLRRSRVDEQAILAAARELQGLERMDQVRYAVLERNGTISIIPVRDGASAGADT
ncbi:MAG: DUF421 domain-containing protein [Isosphaeraceae bacterium]